MMWDYYEWGQLELISWIAIGSVYECMSSYECESAVCVCVCVCVCVNVCERGLKTPIKREGI